MSNTILESIRSKNEELEHLEKALTKAIAYKENNLKEKVNAEMIIKKFIQEIKKCSKELLDLYEDKDGLKKEEIDILAGNKNFYDSNLSLISNSNYNSNRTPDVWLNFYEKVKEVKFINRKILNNNEFTEHINFEKMFNSALEEINNKPIFSAEENKGKCVDMHEIYQKYMNLKKIKEGNFLNIDDYLTFLSEFHKFDKIPIYLKKHNNYREYLNFINKYLKSFFEKSNPMIEINTILDSIDEEFEQSWKEAKIPGWENYLKQLRNLQEESNIKIDGLEAENLNIELNKNEELNRLFCVACQKLFTNPSVFEHHKKGKQHVKNAEKIKAELNNSNLNNRTNNLNPVATNNGNNNTNKKEELNLGLNEDEKNINQFNNSHNSKLIEKIKEANESKEEEIRSIAYYEFSISKFYEILADVIENTQNTIRKKQSRNYDEIEAEFENSADEAEKDEDSEENEKPIYNPKNVPLGWDGKPIPYWLYKLHGLGIEYKCEVCGGASYWGRRAFERHFQEWRHSYGMKCLKIPNTVHFKEVSSIEDALRLHQALLESQKKKSFRPDFDEEFEDTDGNVVNKKMFIDLKRQGLL